MAEMVGWPLFFLGCTLVAIPGLIMLPMVARQYHQDVQ
jgi:MFS transporter, PAT family, beta-lactamase induction signal transducer AmpG